MIWKEIVFGEEIGRILAYEGSAELWHVWAIKCLDSASETGEDGQLKHGHKECR